MKGLGALARKKGRSTDKMKRTRRELRKGDLVWLREEEQERGKEGV